MSFSKKRKSELVEEIRIANAGVWSEYMPQCVDTPPEFWTKEERAKFDMLVDFERRTIETINRLLA